MKKSKKAIILIGYQNDYFSPSGLLVDIIKESVRSQDILKNTLKLIDFALDEAIPLFFTPILFSATYSELKNPQGLMKTIKDIGAFKKGSEGGETIDEIKKYGDKIKTISGKTGFNAFSGTELLEALKELDCETIILAGVVTSVCIESTGRAASERGLNVEILKDCTAGRSNKEHEFYCEEIFPLYAKVLSSQNIIDSKVKVR